MYAIEVNYLKKTKNGIYYHASVPEIHMSHAVKCWINYLTQSNEKELFVSFYSNLLQLLYSLSQETKFLFLLSPLSHTYNQSQGPVYFFLIRRASLVAQW